MLRSRIWRENTGLPEFWVTFDGESTVHHQMSANRRADDDGRSAQNPPATQKKEARKVSNLIVYRPAVGAGLNKSRRLRLGGKRRTITSPNAQRLTHRLNQQPLTSALLGPKSTRLRTPAIDLPPPRQRLRENRAILPLIVQFASPRRDSAVHL